MTRDEYKARTGEALVVWHDVIAGKSIISVHVLSTDSRPVEVFNLTGEKVLVDEL